MSDKIDRSATQNGGPDAALVLDQLGRRFGDRWAIRDVNVKLHAGTVTGFLGPNGAGKTTTIKIVAGLLDASEGRALIGGHDVATEPQAAKQKLAYIPDRPYVFDRLTARELLHYVGGLYGLDTALIEERGLFELQRFSLGGREDDLLGTYSHGMRQRALMAAALMRRPQVMLVDEPMVGLDPEGHRLIKRVLREVGEAGCAVLMSTHTLHVIEEICDRVLVMNRGVLVADASPASLREMAVARAGPGATIEDAFFAFTETEPSAHTARGEEAPEGSTP